VEKLDFAGAENASPGKFELNAVIDDTPPLM
jgi:hypothetical protein